MTNNKPIQVQLDKDADRCLWVDVCDSDGRRYAVSLEFLAHHFGDGSDEVQVNVYKLNAAGGYQSRNRLCVGATPIADRISGAWFEFHEVGDLPHVPNR